MKLVIIIVLAAGCFETHAPGSQALTSGDCYTCHKANYEGTTAVAATDPAVPDHLSAMNVGTYNQQCGDCHNTQTWYSHPEKLFKIATASGAHADIACEGCHLDSTNNSGDAHGANTLCATCHFASETVYDDTLANEHQTLATFNYAPRTDGWTTQNFCLSCHSDGTAKHHDDSIFPQTHHAQTCKDCHNRAAGMDTGGLNAPCAPCHTKNGVRVHNLDQGDPTGCLHCHSGGGGGDNGG